MKFQIKALNRRRAGELPFKSVALIVELPQLSQVERTEFALRVFLANRMMFLMMMMIAVPLRLEFEFEFELGGLLGREREEAEMSQQQQLSWAAATAKLFES